MADGCSRSPDRRVKGAKALIKQGAAARFLRGLARLAALLVAHTAPTNTRDSSLVRRYSAAMLNCDHDSLPQRLAPVSCVAMLLLCLCVGCRSLKSIIARSDSVGRAPPFEQIQKIDVHAHIFEEMPRLVEMMRSNNVSLINVCNRGRDGHLETMHRIARQMYRSQPDLF